LVSQHQTASARELELTDLNIVEAVEGLPLDHREVLELYLELRLAKDPPNNIHHEIRSRLGVTASTSKQRVRRSLTRIRYCVARYPVTPPNARFIVTMRFSQSEKPGEETISDRLAERIAAEFSRRVAEKPGLLDCLRAVLNLRELQASPLGVRQVLRQIEIRLDRYEAGGW